MPTTTLPDRYPRSPPRDWRAPTCALVALAVSIGSLAALGCGGTGERPGAADPGPPPAPASRPAPSGAVPGAVPADSAPPDPGRPPRGAWIGVVLPRRSVDLAADRSGYLSAVLVDVGDAVDEGQVVARLESSELTQDLRMAEAALRMAEAERGAAAAAARQAATRHERRAAHPELISAEELAAADLDARSTEAAEEVAEARMVERRAAVQQLRRRLDLSEIRSPFAGRIARRFLAAGASVAPSTPVVRLATTGVPLIRFAVPPDEADRMMPGARLRVTGDEGELLGRARIRRVAPEIDPVSRMVIAEAGPEADTSEDGAALWAGLAVRVTPEEMP